MYGRGYSAKDAFDGLMSRLTQFGPGNGPGSFTASHTVKNGPGMELLSSHETHEFIYEKVIDQKTTYDYLARRLGIEDAYRGEESEPLGTYYDEREPAQWRNAYAPPEDLYKLMWGIGP